MSKLLEPKEITIETQNGDEKTYTISKFPAIAGREIICKYPTSAIPKLGDYAANEETMFKLMAFVSVKAGNVDIQLTTKTLIDNHIPDWEILMKLEAEMLKYNFSFFLVGKISNFFDTIKATAQQSLSKTLTDSLGQLLQTEKQLSKNSKKSTPSKKPS